MAPVPTKLVVAEHQSIGLQAIRCNYTLKSQRKTTAKVNHELPGLDGLTKPASGLIKYPHIIS